MVMVLFLVYRRCSPGLTRSGEISLYRIVTPLQLLLLQTCLKTDDIVRIPRYTERPCPWHHSEFPTHISSVAPMFVNMVEVYRKNRPKVLFGVLSTHSEGCPCVACSIRTKYPLTYTCTDGPSTSRTGLEPEFFF